MNLLGGNGRVLFRFPYRALLHTLRPQLDDPGVGQVIKTPLNVEHAAGGVTSERKSQNPNPPIGTSFPVDSRSRRRTNAGSPLSFGDSSQASDSYSWISGSFAGWNCEHSTTLARSVWPMIWKRKVTLPRLSFIFQTRLQSEHNGSEG